MLFLQADEGKPVFGRTRFQKLIFLTQKAIPKPLYNFIPHNYGPYCPEVQQDIRILKEKGWLVEEPKELEEERITYTYKITPKGVEVINSLRNDAQFKDQVETTLDKCKEIKDEFLFLPLKELIHYVYNEYPEYTGNSLLNH